MKKIKLTRGLVAMVDDNDFDYLNQFNWQAIKDCNTFYAVRNTVLNDGKHTTIRMHREILNPDINNVIDHIDRNGLNNQKYNLRGVTNAQNCQNTGKHIDNTSGFKGVSWEASRNRWQVNIMVNGKNKKIGRFKDYDEAVLARSKADVKYHPFNAFAGYGN